MEEHKKSHDWRLIAVLSFLSFSIAYALFLFFTRPSLPQQTQTKQTIHNSPTPYPIKTTAKSQIYRSRLYEFTFPVDWVYKEVSTTNGTIVSVLPPTNPPGDYVPSLKVETVRLANTDEAYRNELLTPYPNTETIVVNGHTARKTRVTGTSKIVNGEIIKTPVQEVDIQFDKDGIRYLIRYIYQGEQEDPSIEQQFTQMISSLSLR